MRHMASTSFAYVPECVRGMKKLDRSMFSQSISFPIIRVEPQFLGKIKSSMKLDKYLVQGLVDFKSVRTDQENANMRVLIFDPALTGDVEQRRLSKEISDLLQKEVVFSIGNISINYGNIDLRRAIRGILPRNLDFSSFTQMGHLVHCNFREVLFPFKKIIAEILLDKVHHCKTVVAKVDKISSTFRNFDLELLAGEEDYVVQIIEEGVMYTFDFSEVYWNSRLNNEHKRIFSQLRTTSLLYDACAGVGPFVLPAYKKKGCRKIYANDLNPQSIAWLCKNISLNKVKPDAIRVSNLDAKDFIAGIMTDDILEEIEKCKDPEYTPASGAHILMNLPAYAINFLPTFKGILHGKFHGDKLPFPIKVYCYLFIKENGLDFHLFSSEAERLVLEKLNDPGVVVDKVQHIRTVSNFKEMFCVEMTLSLEFLTAKPEPPNADSDEEPQTKKAKTEA